MFVMSNFIYAIASIINIALTVLYWLILIRALISWVSPDPFNPLVQFLHRVTEPILEPIRRFLPNLAIDLSPLIAFVAIIFLKQFLVASLYGLAARIQ
jgi:YggT family protein